MNHHTDQVSPCPLCAEKIALAHPRLKDVWEDIKEIFPDCHISWSFRDEQTQNEFFKEHKTLAKWPKSKHNAMKDGKPCARAIDLFQIDPDGVAWFPPKYYFDIASYLEKKKTPIEWAGQWPKSKHGFCETDHFQLSKEVI